GNRLVVLQEMTSIIQYFFIQSYVFWSSPTADIQSVVIGWIHFAESFVQNEVMASQFSIGLKSNKVMNSSCYRIARFFVWADNINFSTCRKKCLIGHHD